MNSPQPNIRMWAEFVLSPKSGKTPKYMLTKFCRWVDELEDLVGRDGDISLYLCQKREGQPAGAPCMYLQAKGSLNLTGLKELYEGGVMSNYAWGNPPKSKTYGTKKSRLNPLAKYEADGFLFVFHYDGEGKQVERPLSFEMLWICGAGPMMSFHCKRLQMGNYDEILKRCRDEAIPYLTRVKNGTNFVTLHV